LYVVISSFFFRTLFAQFLAQKIEKEQTLEVKFGQSNNPTYMQDGEICTVKPVFVISEGTVKNKGIQKTDSCGKVMYMGDVQGPEKVVDICVKIIRAGMMDRGFTVCVY
jgi:hypothetical protein